MTGPEYSKNEGLSSEWFIILAAAFAAALGIIGYQAGWFERLLGKKEQDNKHSVDNDPKKSTSSYNSEPRKEESRSEDRKRFEKVLIAAVQYAENKDYRLPANIYGNDGRPLLSWRVAILPALGYEELYDRFHLNEPWNSEHNKKLISKMPEIYAIAGAKASDGLTTVQAYEGEKGVAIRPVLMRGDRKGASLDIPDGTSNVAMCIEAAKPVEWTKPQDMDFSLTGPLPAIGKPGQGAILLLLDGSTHVIPNNTHSDWLRAVGTINGDERWEWGAPTLPPTKPTPTPPRPAGAGPGPRRR